VSLPHWPLPFLLPKSQLQGHFGLCPAAEKPRYLSCKCTVARQKGQRGSEEVKSIIAAATFIAQTQNPFLSLLFSDQIQRIIKNLKNTHVFFITNKFPVLKIQTKYSINIT